MVGLSPEKEKTAMIRMNVSMSDNLAAKLNEWSEESDTSKSEIFRKALTLFAVAQDGKREGKKLGLVDKDGNMVTEIVGL